MTDVEYCGDNFISLHSYRRRSTDETRLELITFMVENCGFRIPCHADADAGLLLNEMRTAEDKKIAMAQVRQFGIANDKARNHTPDAKKSQVAAPIPNRPQLPRQSQMPRLFRSRRWLRT